MFSTLIPPSNPSSYVYQSNGDQEVLPQHYEANAEKRGFRDGHPEYRYRTFDETELLSSNAQDLAGNHEDMEERLVPVRGLGLHETEGKERTIQIMSYEAETVHASHWHKIDRNAVHFGIRMAILLTVSSLFVIVGQGNDYPQGMWVLISVLFVSWFPSLDAASVIEKIRQRLIGTFAGAAIALMVGFPSLYILSNHGKKAQTVFWTCCIATVTSSLRSRLFSFVWGELRSCRSSTMRRFCSY